MTTALKVDSDFTACLVRDGDELVVNGIFEFNITRLFSYIDQSFGAMDSSKYPSAISMGSFRELMKHTSTRWTSLVQ